MSYFSFYLLSFFFYKIEEQESRADPAGWWGRGSSMSPPEKLGVTLFCFSYSYRYTHGIQMDSKLLCCQNLLFYQFCKELNERIAVCWGALTRNNGRQCYCITILPLSFSIYFLININFHSSFLFYKFFL
jgi:hypothetical protein